MKVVVIRHSSPTTVLNSPVRTSDVTGTVTLGDGVEMVMPGDNVAVDIQLIAPVAMEKANALPFAKAAGPSVRALSLKSSNKFGFNAGAGRRNPSHSLILYARRARKRVTPRFFGLGR